MGKPTSRRLGATFRAQGDFERAAEHYREALRSKPDWGQARLECASLLADHGALEPAVAEYRVGLHFEPDHALARKLRGLALLELGRPQEAWDELSQAAAAGSFDLAVRTQERAVELAAREDEARARALERRLRLYAEGRAYVQGQPLPDLP